LPGIGAWSEGVVAAPGHHIVHVTLRRPSPYVLGFEAVADHLKAEGRPATALCAIELRIPSPLTLEGFRAFNEDYFDRLASWGLTVDGLNPVARTNVAPVVEIPPEPSLYAFAYAAPASSARRTFVVAGAAELRDNSLQPETIVRRGETGVDAMQEKAAHVMEVVDRRMRALGATWGDATEVSLYTAHELDGLIKRSILSKTGPAARHGVRWHLSRPPIDGIEIEVDVRGVGRQVFIE
jgi:hypothetical protein